MCVNIFTEYEGSRFEREIGGIGETVEGDEENLGGENGRNGTDTSGKCVTYVLNNK